MWDVWKQHYPPKEINTKLILGTVISKETEGLSFKKRMKMTMHREVFRSETEALWSIKERCEKDGEMGQIRKRSNKMM